MPRSPGGVVHVGHGAARAGGPDAQRRREGPAATCALWGRPRGRGDWSVCRPSGPLGSSRSDPAPIRTCRRSKAALRALLGAEPAANCDHLVFLLAAVEA